MGPKSQLGELERAVLEALWELDDDAWATVRQVHESLAAQRSVAYTTVMTVLDRLARKGVVEQRRDGRAYLYRAQASRGEMTAELMRATLAEFGSDHGAAALVAFVAEASEDERDALRAALARLDQDA